MNDYKYVIEEMTKIINKEQRNHIPEIDFYDTDGINEEKSDKDKALFEEFLSFCNTHRK